MIYFEFKKVLKTKRMVMAATVFMITTLYAVMAMSRADSIGSSDPFLEFQGTAGLYQLIILLLLTIVMSSFFPTEEENGLTQIMTTSKYGKSKLASAKTAAALITANGIFLIYTIVLFAGYAAAFGANFDSLIKGGEALEYTTDPAVKTFRDMLIIQAAGMFLSTNFTTLLSLFLSSKLKKAFPTAVIIVLSYIILGLMPDMPLIGIIFHLTPMCLAGRAVTYQVLFSVGTAGVTILHVGFLVYMILNIILFFLIKSVYKKGL